MYEHNDRCLKHEAAWVIRVLQRNPRKILAIILLIEMAVMIAPPVIRAPHQVAENISQAWHRGWDHHDDAVRVAEARR
jgi:hypothetical protein